MYRTIIGSAQSRQVFIDGVELRPEKSQAVYNHSPDGFCWGYGGSGPSQLALAILLEVLDKDQTLRFYQDFKWEYIAKLDMESDFSFEVDIEEWVERAKS